MPGPCSIGAIRAITFAAATRGEIALRQQLNSGFTLGSTACACDANRIATKRCIDSAERPQMLSLCVYDFCHDDLPTTLP